MAPDHAPDAPRPDDTDPDEPDPDVADREAPGSDRPVPSRRALWAVAVGIGIFFTLTQIGNVVGPVWVEDRPLLLMAFTGLMRWQVLAVNQIDPGVFLVVATIRLMAPDPLFYLLGYWYGDSAIAWIERRSPAVGAGARKFEHYFKMASYPLVFIAPNNAVCLLAGANRMRPAVFAVLNLAGTLTRVALIIWLGQRLGDPIDSVLGFIATYRWWIIALSLPIVAVSFWREFSQGAQEVGGLPRSDRDGESAPPTAGRDPQEPR